MTPRHLLITAAILIAAVCAAAQQPAAPKAGAAAGGPELIQPAQLVKMLQAPKGERPLVLQIGFRVLYTQAHIPGSEYVGPASDAKGIEELRNRVKSVPHNRLIVLYCGCCPWVRCPNVQPAYRELRSLGFQNVKVLYIADNFGADWVEKGYPVAKD